jgi:hypothetical protein
MNKLFKTILIGSIVIFGAGFLFASPTNATELPPLYVEWSVSGTDGWQPLTGAIFNEVNFLPGNAVIRYIRVTNSSGETQRIALETINESDNNGLASQMTLVIEEGATGIFNNTLRHFFDQGATFLSNLSDGATTVYKLTITFNSDANNDYQEKTVGFDILVGFEGTEGGLPPTEPGEGNGETISGSSASMGGGGGGLVMGLTIQDEVTLCISETDTIIRWLTSYKSTSRVVYGTQSGVFDLTKANYGYQFSTLEEDNTPPISVNGVTGHEVDVLGLTPFTTYYFRAISHASPDTVGREMSFTTLKAGEKSPCCEATIIAKSLVLANPETSVDNTGGQSGGGGTVSGSGQRPAENGSNGTSSQELTLTEEEKESDSSNLLASIISSLNLNSACGLVSLIITILLILYLLSRKRKKEGEEKKKNSDLYIILAVLIILALLIKCNLLIIPIIILLAYLLFKLFKK